METSDIILIGGIVAACIWLGACIVIEGKNRKYAVITGVVIDIVLFIMVFMVIALAYPELKVEFG